MYREYEIGWRNVGLEFDGKEIARTDGNVCIAYSKEHIDEIEEFADEYGCEIEWRL